MEPGLYTKGFKRRVNVALGLRSYDIAIGRGLLASFDFGNCSGRTSALCVVTNSTVWPLWQGRLLKGVLSAYTLIDPIVIEDGEHRKLLSTIETVWSHLLAHRADRSTLLIAVGGGVIGDITGFAAACYQRGIDFIQVPTTLLAMVDSSVGGKTGVNHPLGKNMIGSFHQPKAVICDIDTLSTLPPREYASGIAEVIKYGAITDLAFFEYLEQHMEALVARDPEVLIDVIARCCEIKADVVAKDERESGLREILNFGHTFGHAIEAGLGYGEWLHGEAVAAGMVMGAYLSEALGLLPMRDVNRIIELTKRAGLPVRGPSSLAAAEYLDLMRVDKKARNGAIRYIVLDSLGKARTQPADDALALASIERANALAATSS